MNFLPDQKPKIEYPTFWEYKVILKKDDDEAQIFKEIVGKFEYSFKKSKNSSTGKFKSFDLSVFVFDEESRLNIFKLLKTKSQFVL